MEKIIKKINIFRLSIQMEVATNIKMSPHDSDLLCT